MKNQIIPLSGENQKTFGFTDELLIWSSKRHSTFESLLSSTEKSGMMEDVRTIPISSLKEIIYNEKETDFTIKYDKKGKIKKVYEEFHDTALTKSVIAEIASLKQLNKTIEEESKTSALLWNLTGVLLTLIMTWIAWGMAVDAQNGNEYVATGRRSGIANLVADAIEAIGPTGVLLLGPLILTYFIYKAYKRYSNPASVIKYS